MDKPAARGQPAIGSHFATVGRAPAAVERDVAPPAADPYLVLVVAAPARAARYPTGRHARAEAATASEAAAIIEQRRPTLIAMDWDLEGLDRDAICGAARMFPGITIMASMSEPSHAPHAIKAGCRAILLEPFVPLLAATRIGRLLRPSPSPRGNDRSAVGTNQRWPHVHCPACGAGGVLTFEIARRRSVWCACLECDHVWIQRPPR